PWTRRSSLGFVRTARPRGTRRRASAPVIVAFGTPAISCHRGCRPPQPPGRDTRVILAGMHRGIALLSFLAALELGCAHHVRPAPQPTAAPLESVRMGPTMTVRDLPPPVFKDPKRQDKI